MTAIFISHSSADNAAAAEMNAWPEPPGARGGAFRAPARRLGQRHGVIPRLKKKPAEWLPVPPFRPQQEPLDELAMALAAAFEAHGRPRDWGVIRAELHAAAGRNPVNGLALLNLARDLAIVVKQPETTVLLTIDQAELFGFSSPEAATRFLRLLRVALEAADRRLMAVATLRSDFLGEFQSHPALQDSEYPHHFRYRAVPVDPMPLRNFSAIIQGPARLAGVQLDDGLVEAMVHDTGARDALPLLAFTLRRLYERYGGDGHLSVDEYESLGRLEDAIREEAQRVIAEADPSLEELEALHAAFVAAMGAAMPAAAPDSTTCPAAPSRCCGASSTRASYRPRSPEPGDHRGGARSAVAHLAAARRLARRGPGQATPARKHSTLRRGVGPGRPARRSAGPPKRLPEGCRDVAGQSALYHARSVSRTGLSGRLQRGPAGPRGRRERRAGAADPGREKDRTTPLG